MKYWCLSIAFFATVPNVYADPPRTPRPLDAWASETFERGMSHSPLVRYLVGVLEGSNVVVHIDTSTMLPMGIGGMTRFVTSQGGYRYLRITLARDITPFDRASILGHELQHACEIATSPADTIDAVRNLFVRLGGRTLGRGDYFETRAALLAGQQVAVELRGTRELKSAHSGR